MAYLRAGGERADVDDDCSVHSMMERMVLPKGQKRTMRIGLP